MGVWAMMYVATWVRGLIAMLDSHFWAFTLDPYPS
jgi:hypothetical protein